MNDYFEIKYSKVPYIKQYVKILQSYNIPPKKMDFCLNCIANKFDRIFLDTTVGVEITNKLCKVPHSIIMEEDNPAPVETLNALYKICHSDTPYEMGKHSIYAPTKKIKKLSLDKDTPNEYVYIWEVK